MAEVSVASLLKISGQFLYARFEVKTTDPFSYRQAEDLEEQIGAMLVNGQVAEFVKDEEGWPEIGFQTVFELSRSLCSRQGVDDIDSGSEQDTISFETGLIAKGGCQVGFTETDTAEQYAVGFLIDEVEQKEMLQLWSIDFLRPVPLELIKSFGYRKTSHADTTLDGMRNDPNAGQLHLAPDFADIPDDSSSCSPPLRPGSGAAQA